MNKEELLNILVKMKLNFKDKFIDKTTLANNVDAIFSNLKNTLINNINSSFSIISTQEYLISKYDTVKDELTRIVSSIIVNIDNKKDILINSLNSKLNDIDSKYITDNDYNNTIIDFRDSIRSNTDSNINSINDLKTGNEIDSVINSKTLSLNSNISDLSSKIELFNTVVGESDKYDTLPTKDQNGYDITEGDLVFLSENDGIYKSGLYIYKNNKFIIFNRIKHTRITLRALINAYLKDRNNLVIQHNIIFADTSDITDMSYLVGTDYTIRDFNLDISNWDVSNVTNMRYMFGIVETFNQDISKWDTSNVTDMSNMFYKARAFNQDISNWNVSNVTTMEYMFNTADVFNQNISNWDVSNVTNWSYFRDNSALSDANTPPKFR